MCRTSCVLALLTMQAGLAHSFSWDIVAGASNRLEFYSEEKLTYSVTLTDVEVRGITCDPFHNRLLLMNSSESVVGFDIATGKIQTLIHLPDIERFAYDPATGLLFVITLSRPESYKIYSYLVKPGSNHEVDANLVTDLGVEFSYAIAVDSCGGYIYWVRNLSNKIERARINGSAREEVIESSDKSRSVLIIDPEAQNMYWTEYDHYSEQYFILSADLNGKHRKTIYHGHGHIFLNQFTVSKDFIYWKNSRSNKGFWKFPKNLPLGTNVKPKQIAWKEISKYRHIAANYAIEEKPQGTPLCKALKRLLPNYSATDESDSLNVSTGVSLLRVNETKVSRESRVSDDTWDVSVCQYYCLQGHCSTRADGQPECRCNVGYSGVRCEVNTCQAYCLNDGVCSLSEDNNPVCQCTGGYQGERCDIPDFLIKCSQAVSLFKDILNADLASITEGKGVKSTCVV